MWTESERQTLTAAAERVLPADSDTPGAGDGAPEFFAHLFATDRAAQLGELREFLADGASESDVFFPLFAEVVHEHYWTSPAGMAAVGFTITG